MINAYRTSHAIILLVTLLSASLLGCGGGASGTGGIIGDLAPTQKLSDIEDGEKKALCGRVVNVATEALRTDAFLSALSTARDLTDRYITSESTTDNSGFVTTIWNVTPQFKVLTKESFVRECSTLFASKREYISKNGECFNVNEPIPSIGWKPPSVLEPGAFRGVCDLNNSQFAALDISVGEYAACFDEYVNTQLFSPDTSLSCEDMFDLLNQEDPSAAFDTTLFVRDLPLYSNEICPEISRKLGRSLFVSSPVVCDARPVFPGPYLPTVFLAGG
jgi:hypothetical protein